MDPQQLPDDFVEGVRRYKFRGSSGQGQPRARRAAGLHLHAGPRPAPARRDLDFAVVDYMEQAYDDAKYGRFSTRPYMDIVIPSLTDPSVAPPGKHVMSCFVQYAPYHLKEGHVGRAARGVWRHRDRHHRASTRRTSRTSSGIDRC